MDSPITTSSFAHPDSRGPPISAPSSTVSSPPVPRTPPADAYPHPTPTYSDFLAMDDPSNYHNHQQQQQQPLEHQQQSHHHQHPFLQHQQSIGAAMGDSMMGTGTLPPSPGFPLHPIGSAPSHHSHSIVSSAANTPPKDNYYAPLPSSFPPSHTSDYDGNYLGQAATTAAITIPRHGSFSSVSVSSSYNDYEYDEGPPPLEKAPREVVSTGYWQQEPQYPPHLPPSEGHMDRRGSAAYTDDLYYMNSPTEEAPPSHHYQQREHQPYQLQRIDASPHMGDGYTSLSTYSAAPSPDMPPSQLMHGGGGLPMHGISRSGYGGWQDGSVSPGTQNSATPPPQAASSYDGSHMIPPPESTYQPPAPPPFLRRYTSPVAPNQLSPEDGYQQRSQVGDSPPPLQHAHLGLNEGRPSFRTFVPPINNHVLARHPSLPHLSAGREPQFQPQSSPLAQPQYPPLPGLSDSRLMHRSNSLPTSSIGDLPLHLQPPQPPYQTHRFQPSPYDPVPAGSSSAARSKKSPPSWASQPPTGPVILTDDASSKETANLRRKCYNCGTTEPPSWRRSTLTPGKIVCNRCGLYERTHLKARPSGNGGELRKPMVSTTTTRVGGMGMNPYPIMPMHSHSKPSGHARNTSGKKTASSPPTPAPFDMGMPQLQPSGLYPHHPHQDVPLRAATEVQSTQ